MGQRLSNAEVNDRLKVVNQFVVPLSAYSGHKNRVQCECRVCHNQWQTTWNIVLTGHGCPKCSLKRLGSESRFTLTQIKTKLKKLNPTIRISGQYKNSRTDLPCECLVCGQRWKATWKRLSQKHGCPKCGLDKVTRYNTLAEEDVKQKLKKFGNSIELVSRYQKSNIPIKVKHKTCGTVWKISINHLGQDRRVECPICKPNDSFLERRVRKSIESLTGESFPKANPTVVPFLHGLHLDCYNKGLNLAIEVQGAQHYRIIPYWHKNYAGFLRQKRRDRRKKIQCWRHGVKLIRVPYWIEDVDKFLKQRLPQNMLRGELKR